MSFENRRPDPDFQFPVGGGEAGLSRRELLQRLAGAGMAAPFASAVAAAQTPTSPSNVRLLNVPPVPGGKAVMKPEDLKFLGFIRYPQTGVGDLWYSSKTFAIRKVGSELRMLHPRERDPRQPHP